MEQEEYIPGIGDYLAIVKRRKNLLIFPAIIIFIAAILAFSLPSIYRSEGTILIEQQEIPSDLVRSTVTSYAGERIQVISQRVMTTENLGNIIKEYGLYKEEIQKESLAAMVGKLRDDMSLEMVSADVVDPRSGRSTTATIAFKLAFNHENPRQAQKVTNELISLFLNENLKLRTKSALETSSFLMSEAQKLGDEVGKLEAAMAEFKEQNINNLPELQQLNIQMMERAEGNLKDIDQNIRTLEGNKIYLSSELAQMRNSKTILGSGGKQLFLSAEDRLKVLQMEYISMSSRYSKAHPDLNKMNKEIEALKKETGYVEDVGELQQKLADLQTEMVTFKQRYSSEHPDVKKLQRAVDATSEELQTALKADKTSNASTESETVGNNPSYTLLKAQLNKVNAELESLLLSREVVREKIKNFEIRLLKSPQIERKYKELNRDYENSTLKYREFKNKQLEAELSTSLERENKGERFSLIEPPLVPKKPVKPNRPAIVFLGLILAIGVGFGLVAIVETMNSAIYSPLELVNIINEQPIVVIPYIETDAERAKQQGQVITTVVTLLLGGLAFIILFHLFVMPLDVLWYVLMRKFGLSD